MSFQIVSLQKASFNKYFEMDEKQLLSVQSRMLTVDSDPGYPCRVSLQDAKIGERVLAIPYLHLDVNSPYRASGPIFIRENAEPANLAEGEIPEMLRRRPLSLRGYDSEGLMQDARITPGKELESIIEEMFQSENVDYIHVHNSGPGCFNCVVQRTD